MKITTKIISLSIAAMSIASTLNAESLIDAFKDAKVSGVVQAYNFAKQEVTGQEDYDITTLGLDLSYETARFYNFGAKATFQAAASPWIDDDAEVGASGDMWGSGSVLSEMYISYKMANTTAQIGRMYVSTPLVAGSGSRVNKEAFQGATFVNSDLPDTTLTLAFVNKFQARTDSEGNIGTFEDINDDGAYTVSVKNKSVKDLTLTAAYLDSIDAFTTAYIEAGYKFNDFGLSAQYYNSEKEDADSTYLIGVRGTATFGPVDLLAAYVTVSDEAEVSPGLGNGADLAYTWSEIFSWQYRVDQDSYKVGAKYNINKNVNIGASYVNEDAQNYTYAYTALIASYTFTGELKGLSVYATYEIGSEDADQSGSRVKFNYAF
ncbi:MAG: imipenem/basic amino acid-specific outer membrane pore [Sulfurimonas sp.]|jgi:imipenem/basic amino acid-specific outer membrane pore